MITGGFEGAAATVTTKVAEAVFDPSVAVTGILRTPLEVGEPVIHPVTESMDNPVPDSPVAE